MSSEDASALINKLSSLSSHGALDSDAKARKEALRLSKALAATLDEPENVAVELAFSPFVPMSARVAVDLDLFTRIVSHKGPITAKELASLSGAEELLIIRILRPLSAVDFVREVAEQTWEATGITKAMANHAIAAGHRMVWEMIVGAAAKAPRYMKEAGYACPTDPKNGLMQYAHHTKLQTFELFSSRPEILRDFNTFMGNTMGARNYWVDWFPVQEHLLQGAKQSSALLVDVGGGKGHDLVAFHRKYPRAGRLVLQDLAPVIDNIKDLDPAIERQKYDFFTTQPVHGARAYFYHHILHDWSDEKCLEILRHVREAMTPGYSRLLLHELILPEQGASSFQAMLDLVMMAFNGGMERSGKQWRLLLEKAGFEIVKLWLPEGDGDGIVEAMVRE